jgi:hypothetical protein
MLLETSAEKFPISQSGSFDEKVQRERLKIIPPSN